ncbi:MAG: element excision factor XisH family protein [Isosphaeraceae bacterium]
MFGEVMGTRVSSQRSSNASQNIYHDAVVRALIAEGWTITHDPLTLSYGGKDLFVDLGAERVTLAAEKTGQRIAVEIQSFLSPSPVRDLQEAIGQYEIYRAILAETEPERLLFLAAPLRIYENLLSERFGQLIISRLQLRLLIFDETQQKSLQWINESVTASS